MPAVGHKDKTVTYRRMEITDLSGNRVSDSFETLFRKALEKTSVPISPVMPLGTEGQGEKLILFTPSGKREPFNRAGCACGCISFYDTNQKIPLVGPEKEGIYEEEIEPVDRNGIRRNLERSPIFFAIKGNHVALIIPSFSGIRNFISFMYWLLQDMAQVTQQCSMDLVNIPSQSAMDSLGENKVKGFSFKSEAYESYEVPMTEEEIQAEKEKGRKGKRKHVKKEFHQTSILKGILQAIGAESILEGFQTDEDLGKLCVAVDFSYRSRTNEEGRQAVVEMAQHCGGIDGLETTIRLDKGSIKNSELTIKDTVSIQAPNGNLVRTDALLQLSNWLKSQLESGNIPA